MDERDQIEQAVARLRERITELRRESPAGKLTDRVVDFIGDACTIAGLILLFVFPVDPISVALSTLGIGILGYNHFIRMPRIEAREQMRRRQIDMLEAQIDRMELDLIERRSADR